MSKCLGEHMKKQGAGYLAPFSLAKGLADAMQDQPLPARTLVGGALK